MDGAFVEVIWRVRASKADLLEQESSRMSPDFVSVDTLFWMDRGTCCEHSARSLVGATFSSRAFFKNNPQHGKSWS